jgi:hypothetical protein
MSFIFLIRMLEYGGVKCDYLGAMQPWSCLATWSIGEPLLRISMVQDGEYVPARVDLVASIVIWFDGVTLDCSKQ